ncbi:MAG TPA: MerR family transcriptional regulator [Acidimicrobiales bacterium]|nr:MerR family transcriptional regulator [Acidimicrobiales bacterium]
MSTHSDHSSGDRRSRTIREVLDLLAEEFPDVTVSKIRFLESRGLIRPERTPSGYRKFDDGDVERLRWILQQQRENFLPLKVIKGRLEQGAVVSVAASLFDDEFASEGEFEEDLETSASRHPSAGFEPDPDYEDADVNTRPDETSAPESEMLDEMPKEEPSPTARVKGRPTGEQSEKAPATTTESPRRGRAARKQEQIARTTIDGAPAWSAEELVTACSVDLRTILSLDEYGLLDAEGAGDGRVYRGTSMEVVRLAAQLRAFGVEARHLRTFKHAAERDAGVIAQVITPMFYLKNPEARRRAGASLADLKALGSALHEVFLSAALDDLERS